MRRNSSRCLLHQILSTDRKVRMSCRKFRSGSHTEVLLQEILGDASTSIRVGNQSRAEGRRRYRGRRKFSFWIFLFWNFQVYWRKLYTHNRPHEFAQGVFGGARISHPWEIWMGSGGNCSSPSRVSARTVTPRRSGA